MSPTTGSIPKTFNATEEWTFTARWLFPVTQPPLANGTITIRGDRIIAVESAGARKADSDLGNTAIVPGFVNAHTHLDLSGMRGVAPPSADFTGWLKQVTEHRRNTSPEQTERNVKHGVAELLAAGTTLVGDISADGASTLELTQAPLRAVVFHEVLGVSSQRASQTWDQFEQWLCEPVAGDTVRKALSPHAPYSVSRRLFHQCALRTNLPIAIHVGETREELQLLDRRSGPFATFLQDLGAWDPQALVASVDEVASMFAGRSELLIVHANYLTPAQIPQGATVVYCPRTHAAFGHAPHPFGDFLKAGIRVALGTDSLASNPDLDVFAEAQFLFGPHPGVAGGELLRMITLNGAEALGWADETGTLLPGKSADFVGVPLADQDDSDPYRVLFNAAPAPRFVMFRGRTERRKPPGDGCA